MGASLVYLEKPNTAVEFASGEDERLRFAAGEMQGWRLNMVSEYGLSPKREGDRPEAADSLAILQ